ncbi:MAG: hypothetical protein V4489_09205 [Chlamydiota bacterium]
MHSKLRPLLLFSSILSSSYSYSIEIDSPPSKDTSYTPLYAGSLLAFFSENAAPGQWEIEPYLYQTTLPGIYDQNWSFQKEKSTHELSVSLLLETGITSYLDVTLFMGSTYSQMGNQHTFLYQDTQVYLGFQVLHDTKNSWIPDLRFLVGENFPTGKYQHLIPEKQLSDNSGSGAYETSFFFVVAKTFYCSPKHPFNINFNFEYILPCKTNVKGYNLYGGGSDTRGTISPGKEYMLNLAIEYSLTQNWVIGTDIHYVHQNKSTFSGNPGVINPFIGLPSSDQISLAPCLQYNFNANFGLFIASWFTVAGRNSDKFINNTLSAYWVF